MTWATRFPARVFVGIDLDHLAKPQVARSLQVDKAGVEIYEDFGITGVDAKGAGWKADAKLQYLDAHGAGGGIVAKLVYHHENQQHRNKGSYGDQDSFHAVLSPGYFSSPGHRPPVGFQHLFRITTGQRLVLG